VRRRIEIRAPIISTYFIEISQWRRNPEKVRQRQDHSDITAHHRAGRPVDEREGGEIDGDRYDRCDLGSPWPSAAHQGTRGRCAIDAAFDSEVFQC
jgi:hypothetical protein